MPIYQEAALSSDNCVVMCGAMTMPYSVLQYFADRVVEDESGIWSWADSAIGSLTNVADPKNSARHHISHLVTVLRMKRAWNAQFAAAPTKTASVMILTALRTLNCTHPRDRVFSASAFVPRQLIADLRGDQVVSARELYIKFARVELVRNESVQCLSAAGLCHQQRSYPSKYHAGPTNPLFELPSWVSDWTYRKVNDPMWVIDQRYSEKRGEHLYTIATETIPHVNSMTDVHGLAVIAVKGVLIDDVVACLKPFHVHIMLRNIAPEKKPDAGLDMNLTYEKQFRESILFGQRHRTPGDVSESGKLTAIRQTLISSMMPAAEGKFVSSSLLVKSKPEHVDLMFEVFDQDVKEARRMNTQKSNLAASEIEPASPESAKAAAERSVRHSLIPAAVQMYKGRRTFATSNQSIGIELDITIEGDNICVFHGGCTSFIIRRVSGGAASRDDKAYYQLVGECYAHGLMDDEILGMEDVVPEDILPV